MTEPRTEAGRRLITTLETERRADTTSGAWRGGMADAEIMVRDALPAVEAEAVIAALTRLREEVAAKRHAEPTYTGLAWNAALGAVLRAIDEEAER